MQRISSTVIVCAVLSACGAERLPPPAHTGWTLRYTQRVGEGVSPPRDVRPDIGMRVLDGRASVATGAAEARLDHAQRHAEFCRAGTCTAADYDAVLTAISSSEALHASPGAAETNPTVELLSDPIEVASIRTSGGRFVGGMRGPTGTVRITTEVRWIDRPGDPSVEVAKDFFLTPLQRLGAPRLVELIRQTAGLPLSWEVRIVNERPDGSSVEGAVALRAAEIANPPSRLGP
jgi:hypothetical protein